MNTPSYVYFLSDGEYIKIGSSIHPFIRRKQADLEQARFLFGIFVPLPNQGRWIEHSLHRHFADKQVAKEISGMSRQEWFALSTKELETIRELRFVYDEAHGCFYCECHPHHYSWMDLGKPCRLKTIPFGFAYPKEVAT